MQLHKDQNVVSLALKPLLAAVGHHRQMLDENRCTHVHLCIVPDAEAFSLRTRIVLQVAAWDRMQKI